MTKQERKEILEQQLELLHEDSKEKSSCDKDISDNSIVMLKIVEYLDENT